MRVLNWARHQDWREGIMGCAKSTWGQLVISAFLKNPPQHVSPGSLNWLFPYITNNPHEEPVRDADEVIVDALKSTWTHIRAFHGCITTDVKSYYNQGIKPLSLNDTNRYAHNYFVRACPRLNSRSIDRAIKHVGQDYDASDERAFFALDCAHLLQHCGHYLIYGSEYLLALAGELTPMDSLGDACDLRWRLKGRGRPTVFACHLPIDRVEPGAVVELARLLVAETFKWLRNPAHVPLSRRFGFPIGGSLEPEYIIKHFHPAVVRDPLGCFLSEDPSRGSCIYARNCKLDSQEGEESPLL